MFVETPVANDGQSDGAKAGLIIIVYGWNLSLTISAGKKKSKKKKQISEEVASTDDVQPGMCPSVYIYICFRYRSWCWCYVDNYRECRPCKH